MFDKILMHIAPHFCLGCKKPGAILCEHCVYDIISEPYGFCLVCEGPSGLGICQRCQKRCSWSGATVVGEREGLLRAIIDKYKFERLVAADGVLARLLSGSLPTLPSDTVCTYVPAVAAHRRQRGYDHMKRITQKFAKQNGLQFATLIGRQKDTVQRDRSRKVRLQQQKDAFFAVERAVQGPILLIDDVYTTGATLRSATRALREVYGLPIYVAVVARQPSRDLSQKKKSIHKI